jgi:LysM domain
MMDPRRVTVSARRRRARGRRLHVARLAVVLLAAALVVWGGARVGLAVADSTTPAVQTHVVQPGETVWQIVVGEYGSTDRDVRVLVDEVLRVNHLDSASVVPGQHLLLPTHPM